MESEVITSQEFIVVRNGECGVQDWGKQSKSSMWAQNDHVATSEDRIEPQPR